MHDGDAPRLGPFHALLSRGFFAPRAMQFWFGQRRLLFGLLLLKWNATCAAHSLRRRMHSEEALPCSFATPDRQEVVFRAHAVTT